MPTDLEKLKERIERLCDATDCDNKPLLAKTGQRKPNGCHLQSDVAALRRLENRQEEVGTLEKLPPDLRIRRCHKASGGF